MEPKPMDIPVTNVVFGVPFLVLWEHGLSLLPFEFRGVLRMVCRSWRADIKEDFAFPLVSVVNCAAFNGYLSLCEIMFSNWGATDRDGMLVAGAKGGHKDICVEAKKGGATRLFLMIEGAAEAGHADICSLAIMWIMTDNVERKFQPNGPPLKCCLLHMLKFGAIGGHAHICVLAKEQMERCGQQVTVEECEETIVAAARHGHLTIAKIVMLWMCTSAPSQDTVWMCTLVPSQDMGNRWSSAVFGLSKLQRVRKCARKSAQIALNNKHDGEGWEIVRQDECASFLVRFSICGTEEMLVE